MQGNCFENLNTTQGDWMEASEKLKLKLMVVAQSAISC